MSRIIVADDDEIIVEIVRQALADEDHIIGWLADGQSALDVIRQRPPDLVILDCNMPGMARISVLREMRKSAELWDVPVLMLTGRQSENDERIGRYEGATDYMRKPFSPAALAQKARALLDGARTRG